MNGCINLFRKEVEREKELTDAELRLYLLYRRLVDWDVRHRETFGTVKISIASLRALHLPSKNWSIGKVSETKNQLIKKGFLERVPGFRIRVNNFWLYQANVRQTEKAFRLIEKGVQITESNFRDVEYLTAQERVRDIQKMKLNIGKSFDTLKP